MREEPQEGSAGAPLDATLGPGLGIARSAAMTTVCYTSSVTAPVFPVIPSVKRELPNDDDGSAGHKPSSSNCESYSADDIFEA